MFMIMYCENIIWRCCFEYYGKITFRNDTFTVHFTTLLSCTPHPGRSHVHDRPLHTYRV